MCKEMPVEPVDNTTDTHPLFSVIIPCYNVEDRVRECLDSVLNQSVGLENLELIIVDDASTDNTVDVLKEYEERYPDNIAVILCEENGRQGRARNIGLSYASGEWICFVDSDDMIHRQMLEVLHTFIEATAADLVTFKYTSDDGFLKTDIDKTRIDCRFYDLSDSELRRSIVLRNDVVNNSCTQKLYSRSLIDRTGARFAEGVSYEEPLFTYPIRCMADRVAVLDLPLYYYHLNPEGTINKTMSDPSTIADHISTQIQLLDFMRQTDLYDVYKNEIELNSVHCLAWESYFFIKKRGFDFPESLRNSIGELLEERIPDWQNNPYLDELPTEEKLWLDGIQS